MQRKLLCLTMMWVCISCSINENRKVPASELHDQLMVKKGETIIRHQDGSPFLWLGCTAWGMPEWLNREEVDFYLDDRKSKGFNVVQLCLFWGKRQDYPTTFTPNAKNPYGYAAFQAANDAIDPLRPAVVEGGSPESPNDYWDHVDYCIQAISKRGMYAAILPLWGRRYLNATHTDHSHKIFTKDNIRQYGAFLGERYGKAPHIIWVNGGDVKADDGGDFMMEYRMLSEGIAQGVTGKNPKWNQPDPAWDQLMMTYHPDGAPMLNSSAWFHDDIWLDFNMIETFVHRDYIVKAIRQDLHKLPVKPTVMGEPHYEGKISGHHAAPIHMRRQGWQSFFAGACGFTYGGAFDDEGNGPLFSPANNWKPLLKQKGATQMIHLRYFMENHNWWDWKPATGMIANGKGEGELEKLVVKYADKLMIYFPDNSPCTIQSQAATSYSWFNTATGTEIKGGPVTNQTFQPPAGWEDGVLMLE